MFQGPMKYFCFSINWYTWYCFLGENISSNLILVLTPFFALYFDIQILTFTKDLLDNLWRTTWKVICKKRGEGDPYKHNLSWKRVFHFEEPGLFYIRLEYWLGSNLLRTSFYGCVKRFAEEKFNILCEKKKTLTQL